MPQESTGNRDFDKWLDDPHNSNASGLWEKYSDQRKAAILAFWNLGLDEAEDVIRGINHSPHAQYIDSKSRAWADDGSFRYIEKEIKTGNYGLDRHLLEWENFANFNLWIEMREDERQEVLAFWNLRSDEKKIIRDGLMRSGSEYKDFDGRLWRDTGNFIVLVSPERAARGW